MKYVHTNLIARNWKKLADFYQKVFDCKPIYPERNLSGEWLDNATGISKAKITGIHLRFPGFDDHGPTLEIFEYETLRKGYNTLPSSPGFSHIAFEVDNVSEISKKIIEEGGSQVGGLTVKEQAG